MPPYDHSQRGTTVIVSLGAGVALCAAVFVFVLRDPDAAQVGGPVAAFVLAILLASMTLFHRLRVVVSGAGVEVAFGFGWPRRVFPLTAIRGARVVRNSWLYGWGIRLIPSGWMFNVSGLDAVELDLALGRKFRIGTDDPQGLESAIRAALGKHA